ncbi:MAG: hypothetical protein PHX93_01725 [Candidatus Peribacteraceae bacterium]|jgi:hypothetical protein|nr:hypothetical protein [Candidatus Peribacteraceae bacterium]
MTDRTKWFFIVGGCALLLAAILQVPQLLYSMQPESQGVLVHLNSDEYQYLARLEEALTGRPEQSAQPYVGDPYVSGMHFALIEQVEGMLFRWTGWRAATVFQILDSVVPVLLFLSLLLFFRLAGFSRRRTLGGALFFMLPLLYSLNRPIHQRESFLLVLSAILLMMWALERRSLAATLLGGALLGVLFGVYLWAWMFAWTYAGLLLLWELAAWWRQRSSVSFRRSRARRMFLLLTVGVIAASPFIISILHSMQNPLYAEVAFRQGMHFTHLPESWIYSSLFLLMSLVLLFARRRMPELQGSKQYAILFPMAVFVVINQQVVHGHVLAFTSHFTFAIALASVCAFLLSSSVFSAGNRMRERMLLIIPLAASTLMLAAITWDNRPVLTQFSVRPIRFSEQHFSTLLPVLDALPRTRILSDSTTSAFISSSTQHDIVMSIYLESAFYKSEEIAERWCLTVLPLPPEQRRIDEQIHLVWPDANAANRGTDVREREVRMVEEACRRLDSDPKAALGKYGVQYVLWDVLRYPDWDVKRLKVPLTLVSEDEGKWVLYKVTM